MADHTITLRCPSTRRRAHEFVKDAPEGWTATFAPPRRSLDQNARMWAMLGEVARQVVWHGQKLSPENWKDVFTAALKRQEVVPGLEGGFVVLGTSTRRMSKDEMGQLMELISAFGAEKGVVFRAAEYEGMVR